MDVIVIKFGREVFGKIGDFKNLNVDFGIDR